MPPYRRFPLTIAYVCGVFQREENHAGPTTRAYQAVVDGRGVDLQQQQQRGQWQRLHDDENSETSGNDGRS